MMLIGLTGRRQVGKSTLSDYLVERHGFLRMHPFDGGKAASEAFFRHLGATPDQASRMVRGDLKDTPSTLLPRGPEGKHFEPRYFLEKFGSFMGVDLGPDWTLNQEIDRLREQGGDRIISESIAFEEKAFRQRGGVIIRIERTGSVPGIETDRAVNRIVPDFIFRNNATDPVAAGEAFQDFLVGNGILEEPTPELELPGLN